MGRLDKFDDRRLTDVIVLFFFFFFLFFSFLDSEDWRRISRDFYLKKISRFCGQFSRNVEIVDTL